MFELMKKIVVIALLVVMTWVGITIYEGYEMYKEALEALPLDDKVAQVTSQEDYTTLDQLPQTYLNAVLAVEDRSFYDHPGYNLKSIARAMVRNFQDGELSEGGSTLTQQLAKLWYFELDKTYVRKVAELFMALDMEKNYEKDEILEFYFNTIYYGSGYYNVHDASMGYFGKTPSDMNDYECTLLAGIPNAPSVYSPDVNPELAEQRRQQVILCMEQYGYIEKGEIQ